MKKRIIACTVTAALSATLTFGLMACGQKQETAPQKTQEKTEQVEKAEDQGKQTDWKDAKTAEEAAKGAGFELFGVPESVKIDDLTFENPTYSYADGVARASYETGAAGLFLHKADGKHEAPLTDRDTDEFACTWTKEYDGIEVTMYGQAKGATTVMTWKDDAQEFGVTYQGLGGEELSMDSDTCAEIVKAVREANVAKTQNADEKKDEKKDEQQNTETTNDAYIGEDKAKSIAINAAGNAENVTCELQTGGDAAHYNVTLTTGGVTYLYEIDAYTGAIWTISEVNGGSASSSATTNTGSDTTSTSATTADSSKNPYTKDQAIALFEAQSGAKASSAELFEHETIGWVWKVSGTDASGTYWEGLVDSNGSVLF